MDENKGFNRDDRDLLIEMRTQMNLVLKYVTKVDVLEGTKADKTELITAKADIDVIQQDHEKRIRATERWVFMGGGALAIIQFVAIYFHG